MSTPQDLAQAVQDFVSTVLTAVTDPRDSIAVFNELAQFSLPDIVSQSAIGAAQQTLQGGVADLCRRAAACALAQAATLYQPNSYDDAQNIRTNVCAILDNEIAIAGDQGQDQTFIALKQLRAAVVQDLTARGATLAPLVTIITNSPMPSLALANRLYRDIRRNDQLVDFANPIHPAFMPVAFKALAS
jgi:prophage DNA circulation protein